MLKQCSKVGHSWHVMLVHAEITQLFSFESTHMVDPFVDLETTAPYRLLAIDTEGCYSAGIFRAESDDEALEKARHLAEKSHFSSFALYRHDGVNLHSHVEPKDEKTFLPYSATVNGLRLF